MISVPYKIVWIASMPRSASMWAFNVARALLREAGFSVFPDTLPKSDESMVAEARKGMRDTSPNNVWCLKVHSGLRNASPSNRFISTFRDPRDAVVSFMRFMRYDFDTALSAATIWTQLCDHYRAFPPDRSLCLDYDRIIANPSGVAGRISYFLKLDLAGSEIAQAIAEFEREKIRRRTESLRAEAERGPAAGDVDVAEALILNADGTMRFWDPHTGFQSDHISDYRDGDWRILLSEDEKRRLDQAIGDWLTQHGYDRRLSA
ncbi:MAG TPA: sulfotransferase [Micropepsaceae bacterium]|jgi:hypothetical protein